MKLKVTNGPIMGSYGLAHNDAKIDVTEEEAKALTADNRGGVIESEEEDGEKEEKRGRQTKEEKSAAKKSK